jgi:hypothetical protein
MRDEGRGGHGGDGFPGLGSSPEGISPGGVETMMAVSVGCTLEEVVNA